MELIIPRSFGPQQAAAWFQFWQGAAEAGDLELVLPSGAFLRPTGIALLAAGIAARQERGLRTTLRKEQGAEDAFRYLQRIDFFRSLGVNLAEPFERQDPARRFVPLRRITDERVARELAENSVECLDARLREGPSSPLRMARFVFEELGVNIVQHSAAPQTGFGILQGFQEGLEIAFADAGVGFLASLRRNPEFSERLEDEAEALQLALGKGLTGATEPRRNMGMGLGLLQDFSDRLGGELWIASGNALLRRRTIAGIRTSTVHAIAPWHGSYVCLDAKLTRE